MNETPPRDYPDMRHLLLERAEPNIAGEILRAVAFVGEGDHNSAPPMHYAGPHDLRKGDPIPSVRARLLIELSTPYMARWTATERLDRHAEIMASSRGVLFSAWGLNVEAISWWDGDGTIIFCLSDGEYPGQGTVRLLANYDSKKTYRWEEPR